jgi:hypothetical protein
MKNTLILSLVALLAGGCLYAAGQAYATVYSVTAPTFAITKATRPTGRDNALSSVLVVGHCVNNGSSPNCPHNGETDMNRPAVAKTSGGVTMVGWNWITCGQFWADGNNNYAFEFRAPHGTAWPAVLPTGCNGGACPQWPATVTCTLTGDDPPGAENWTGHSVVQTVTLAAMPSGAF